MLINRSSGDHFLVSTDPAVLEEEADISLHWMDLALYGTREAFEQLSDDKRCERCTDGVWSMKMRNLEALLQPEAVGTAANP